jgi:hypothetical protein
MKSGVAEIMKKRCQEKGYEVEFIPSEIHTDPFVFI